jgi:hypothetical protein
MAETLMNLGQAMPTASTLTAVYTVPSLKTAAISSIIICNQNSSGGAANVRMSIGVGGATDVGFPSSQYFCFASLTTQNMIEITTGISMAAGDIMRCYSDTSNVSFTISGVQVG